MPTEKPRTGTLTINAAGWTNEECNGRVSWLALVSGTRVEYVREADWMEPEDGRWLVVTGLTTRHPEVPDENSPGTRLWVPIHESQWTPDGHR